MVKCDKKMTFQECELNILRHAVDKIETIEGSRMVHNPEVQRMISIVEEYLRKKELICYGGTAINNILPEHDQFYNKNINLPDYDFFSKNALDNAKELADIFVKEGYNEVEAKSGMHPGTYKVFVNFIPIADITYLVDEIYDALKKEAIEIDGIFYTPPDYLRMSMYLELSRPKGDVSRWEKVLKRLTLLNKYYPLEGYKCDDQEIQRQMETKTIDTTLLFEKLRQILVNQGVIFFGSMAVSVLTHTAGRKNKKINKIPDFDVLATDPKRIATIVRDRLKYLGLTGIKIKHNNPIGEVISEHYEIIINNETVVMIYKPLACHSFNVLHYKKMAIKIATIDTMLSFYLAFLYSKRPYYNPDRIVCLATELFNIQKQNRLSQNGLLKRFTINCYGKQETLDDIRSHKTNKYKELMNKRGTREYEKYFLKYTPGEDKTENKKPKKVQRKAKKATKKNKNKKTKKTQRKAKKVTKKNKKTTKN